MLVQCCRLFYHEHLLLCAVFTVEVRSSVLQQKQHVSECTLTSAAFCLMACVCACVRARERGCVGRWACPAAIIRLRLRAAAPSSSLRSPLQAQVAFDNGLNRQMPGRHLAIDHSNNCSFHFPCIPPGEQYLKPFD